MTEMIDEKVEVAIGLTLAIAVTTATCKDDRDRGRYDRDRAVERIVVTIMGAEMSVESESVVEITLEAD